MGANNVYPTVLFVLFVTLILFRRYCEKTILTALSFQNYEKKKQISQYCFQHLFQLLYKSVSGDTHLFDSLAPDFIEDNA